MTTIDKLDISIYIQYARRTQMVEEINQQYRFYEAASIPPQTLLLDVYPKPSELELLLGVVPAHTPWAYFYPPRLFKYQRRSPFAFHRIVPTFGSTDKDEDEEQKKQHMLEQMICDSQEEEQEKKALLDCFKQIDKINSWLSYIVGRVGQFLQG